MFADKSFFENRTLRYDALFFYTFEMAFVFLQRCYSVKKLSTIYRTKGIL